MAAKNTAKGKIVQTELERWGNSMPSNTLAKLLVKNYPLDFKDIEDSRYLVRYYRGQAAASGSRKDPSKNKLYKQAGKQSDRFGIPESESDDTSPFILPEKNDRIGIISDLHIPNHRAKPIEIAYQHFIQQGINTIIINGDLLDNTPFTRHEGKRPTASDVRRWFDLTELFLERLRDTFPKCDIYWLEGNHDYWYRRWMNQHAWQLDDDPYFSLQERLHLDDYQIKYISQNQYVMAGKLAICHGHMLLRGMFAPVNAARGIYLRAKKSVLVGHVHVESSHTEPDLHGEIVTTFSTGCLCTLTPEYMPYGGKACHGFATVFVDCDGNFKVNNYRIHKGMVL